MHFDPEDQSGYKLIANLLGQFDIGDFDAESILLDVLVAFDSFDIAGAKVSTDNAGVLVVYLVDDWRAQSTQSIVNILVEQFNVAGVRVGWSAVASSPIVAKLNRNGEWKASSYSTLIPPVYGKHENLSLEVTAVGGSMLFEPNVYSFLY